MKPLIYFKQPKSGASYQGVRLRKDLKGALEMVGVEYADKLDKGVDIIHIISPDDLLVFDKPKAKKAKKVVSALYCERDPKASFLERKEGSLTLKRSAIKVLTQADAVLVPNEEARQYLLKNGINSRIEILPPGIKGERFSDFDDVEATSFYRYFSIPEVAEFALALGDLNDQRAIDAAIAVALANPMLRFYFVGASSKSMLVSSQLAKLNRKCPGNLLFAPILPDDVYRSAMLNAKFHICFHADVPDFLSALEAASAEKVTFSYGEPTFKDYASKECGAVQCASVSELIESVSGYCAGTLGATINGAEALLKENNHLSVGKKLKQIYESL